jgi:hypothetical protein
MGRVKLSTGFASCANNSSFSDGRIFTTSRSVTRYMTSESLSHFLLSLSLL